MLGAEEVKLEVLQGKLQVLIPTHARHLLRNDKMSGKQQKV
jgi:hypothetical protein